MPKYTPEQAKAVGAIIDSALRGNRSRRHPAEVTSDRLGDAVNRWGNQFEAGELDMVGVIRARLEQIAERDTP